LQKIYYISRLLTEQVEFANIIIINKVDLISGQELKKLVSVLSSLNTDARFITTSQGQISITDIVDTWLFNFDEASRAPLRVKEMEW